MARVARCVLGILATFLSVVCAQAMPSAYRAELLDTGQFDAPSEHHPVGGFLFGVTVISPNGRYIATGVGDNANPDPFAPKMLARLDRETGTAELIPEFDDALPVGINDEGAIALIARGAANVSEIHFWSPSTGAIPFGEGSLPAQLTSHGDGVGFPRVLNNFGEILLQNEAGENVLWDPVADTRMVIGLDPGTPGSVDATSLNNFGEVVGSVSFPTSQVNELDVRPFLWDRANGLRILSDLELISRNVSPFIDFGRFATANAINDAGVIAGETRDENGELLGLHWESEATLPTLRPCQSPEMSQPPERCAVWLLNDQGNLVGGEETGDIESHVIWDGVDPFLLRDLIVEGLNICQIYAIANDGTLAGTCGAPALVIPIPSGPELAVTAPTPGEEVLAGAVLVEGLATDDIAVANVTVNGAAADLEPTGNPDDPNEIGFTALLTLTPGEQTIEAVATDSDGNVEAVSLVVNVVDPDALAPTVSDVIADPNPAPVASPIRLTAEIDDTGTGGSMVAGAQYSIHGGPPVVMTAEDGAFDEGRESVFAEIPGFDEPGVYEVCVTGADVIGNVSAPVCTFVAVFDPSGGFVTSGGWIDAPVGAFPLDPLASGRANFGFVAKYTGDASTLTGSTEFQFQRGNLNFRSSGYDWLVVTETEKTARFEGTGTVNGEAAPTGFPYRFMLWAHDGSPDTFRIRIWWDASAGEVTVFDNGTTALGAGSIVIH